MTALRAGTVAVLATALQLVSACASAPPPRPVLPVPPQPVVAMPTPWPRQQVLDLAESAYRCGVREGRFSRPVLTIIDYSLPSTQRRLWVIDMRRGQILHHERVAHGEGSGGTMAVAFSNRQGSHQSSLGLFRTDEIYNGRFGYSLRLSGLEPAINDKARDRAIVMHGAADMSDSFVERWGRAGRSWGCPAVPDEVAADIINDIAGGSAIFAYYPDDAWLSRSRYLNCGRNPYGPY